MDKQTQTLGQRMKSTFSPGGLGFTAAAVGIGAFTAGISQAVGDLINMERLSAQTDAAIRSTGGAANVTRDEIVGMAESMEELTGIEMETVQEGENMLLTFTRVRNEVGDGNDVFDQATEAALNMSVALGTDMTSAAMLVGKALNDPVKGMTAMTRAGIQFTEQQKQMIKAMVESGDQLGAQKIILAELETQFGGSAEAFGQTTAGKMQKFTNAVGNFFEGVVTGAVDMVQDTSGLINNFAMDAGDMGMRIHEIAGAVGEDFTTVKDHIRDNMAETGASFEDAAAAASLHFETIRMEAKVAAAGVTEAMSEGTRFAAEALQRGGPVVAAEAGKIAGMFPSELRAKIEDIKEVGRDSVLALAEAILEKQRDPLLAIEALNNVMEEELSQGELIAALSGAETVASLKTALGSDKPGTRIAAREALQPILDTLNTLGPAGRAAALALLAELAGGLRNVSAKESAKDAARDAGREIVDVFPFSEPKDPRSPFRGITHWNPLRTIWENIAASGPEFAAATRQALGGVGMPSMNGGASAVTAGAAGSGGGPTVILNYSSVVPATEADLREIDKRVTDAVAGGLQRRNLIPRRPRN